MMREVGFCSGIENYSRHLAGREAGSRPWTLIDYFPTDYLLIMDESHISVPQVHGMYKNDRTRKEILVDFGFRLPSALDNRPLTFEEFEDHMSQVVYMSATPGPYETERAQRVAEQFIRPTGVVDPQIAVRPTSGQIDDLINEIRETVARGERVLVTTLTKKMAEDLADYLAELGIKVQWLHSEVDTLERIEILRDLRLGVYDVLVGINLLREGLDLPEVTLVAILDADKEGFLRSGGSLIQVIGRAARNIGGRVIMYADRVTDSMQEAIDETDRRREKQVAYNTEHGIVPETIIKEIRDIHEGLRRVAEERAELQVAGKEPEELAEMVGRLEAQMKEAARNLEFERAAALRDEILQLRRLREELAAAPGDIPADVYAAAAESGEFSGDGQHRSRAARGLLDRGATERHRGGHASPSAAQAPSMTAVGRGGGAQLMAGTMPHAIFMEPDVDGPGTYAAYAAEFPGCAVFGDSDEAAAAAMPRSRRGLRRLAARARRNRADRDRRQLVRGGAGLRPARRERRATRGLQPG